MLACEDLRLAFPGPRTFLKRTRLPVVRGVSLEVGSSRVVCVVGESGCGKTTFGKMAAGLIRPLSGRVEVDGVSLFEGRSKGWQKAALKVQMIHQDPFSALNPVHTVGEELALPMLRHHIVGKSQVREESARLLALTGLDASAVVDKFPHELSGGQRQRVVLARALTVRPQYLVADEAVSMVDVSSRLILLDLMMEVCQSQGIGLLFITHDFGVARYVAHDGEIAVMYMGRLVEQGPTESVIHRPLHPYTRILLSAIPPLQTGPDFQMEKLEPRSYEVPNLAKMPTGCAFAARCPFVEPRCTATMPELRPVDDPAHQAACHVMAAQEKEHAS